MFAFGQDEVRQWEAKCIQEQPAYCIAGCPVHVDGRSLCAAIAEQNYDKARAIYEKSVTLPRSLCRICERTCEEFCRRKDVGGAIDLLSLEREAISKGKKPPRKRVFSTKKKNIAIIGGGISAISAAIDLAGKGHPVSLFTCGKPLGGELWDYSREQLPQSDILEDLELLKHLKVKISDETPELESFQAVLIESLQDALTEQFQVASAESSQAASTQEASMEPRQAASTELIQAALMKSPQTALTQEASMEPHQAASTELIQAALMKSPQTASTQEASMEPLKKATTESVQPALAETLQSISIEINPEDQPDAFTLQIGESKFFAISDEIKGPIHRLQQGKKAAISIDRYLQGVSMTASREKEGSYTSSLYTNIENITRQHHCTDAVSEAQRCLQCECLECVKSCAYLEYYKTYPKKLLRTVYNNLSIALGDHPANKMINSCSLCGQCKAICPYDFDVGEICSAAREKMVESGKMPPSTHDFALKDFAFSSSDEFYLFRRQPGHESSAYLYFPGCQLCASAPAIAEKSYLDLCDRLEGGVGILLSCCGAIAAWAGRKSLLQAAMDKLRETWNQADKPTIIAACPSCYNMFKQYIPEIAVKGLWDLYKEFELPDNLRLPNNAGQINSEQINSEQISAEQINVGQINSGQNNSGQISAESNIAEIAASTFAIHDPCVLRHDHDAQNSVRQIAEKIGCNIEEVADCCENTPCCGWGGLASLANRDATKRRIEKRIAQTDSPYLTYCINCRDAFLSQGKQSVHILELLYGEKPLQKAPNWSEKRHNRRMLRETLLRDVFGEEYAMKKIDISLIIQPDVQALLDERMILAEDIAEVIEYALESGSVVLDRSTGEHIASRRIGNVTFWARYKETQSGFELRSAYSHRMDIEMEAT